MSGWNGEDSWLLGSSGKNSWELAIYREKNRRLTGLRVVQEATNHYDIPSHYRIAFLESLDQIACAAGLLNLAILLE